MVSELGFSDILSVAQTIGIVGTMVLTLYFSKSKYRVSRLTNKPVLNDLNEKYHNMAELTHGGSIDTKGDRQSRETRVKGKC
jgi:hypothetical protein